MDEHEKQIDQIFRSEMVREVLSDCGVFGWFRHYGSKPLMRVCRNLVKDGIITKQDSGSFWITDGVRHYMTCDDLERFIVKLTKVHGYKGELSCHLNELCALKEMWAFRSLYHHVSELEISYMLLGLSNREGRIHFSPTLGLNYLSIDLSK